MSIRQTFTWNPDWGSTFAKKPRVQVTKFGDGYENRVSVGLNNSPEVWTLKFTASKSDTALVLAFLEARNGVESFYWQNPYGNTNVYVCREWKTDNGAIRTVSMDFEQVFEV